MPGARSAPSASSPSSSAAPAGGNAHWHGGGSIGMPRTLDGDCLRLRRDSPAADARCRPHPCGAIPRRGRTPRRSPAPSTRTSASSGLGGSGLAAVGAALEAGARVVGIDAGPVAGGAAGRNGGFLLAGGARFHHDAVAAWGEERAVGIYEESLAELDRLDARARAGDRAAGRLAADPRLPEEAADCAEQLAELQRHGLPGQRGRRPDGRRRVHPRRRLRPAARALPAARAPRAGGRRAAVLRHRGDRAGRRPRRDAGGRGALPRRRRLRRRLDRAAAARARGQARSSRLQMLATAPVAPGTIPCPVYDNWGYEYWQQLPDGARRARRRARHVRRRASGASRPSRAPRSRRCSTGCCASASASTRRSRTAGRA